MWQHQLDRQERGSQSIMHSTLGALQRKSTNTGVTMFARRGLVFVVPAAPGSSCE